MTPQLTKEDLKFIKNLSNEMNTQDTRATAQPYGLVIGQKNTVVTDWDCGDKYNIHRGESDYETYEAFMESLTEDGYEVDSNIIKFLKENCEDISDLKYHESKISDIIGDSFSVMAVKEVEDFSPNNYGGNFFLTEKSAFEYVKRNSHNLNKPFTYGIHLCRNPEMQRLVEIIHKLAGQEQEIEIEDGDEHPVCDKNLNLAKSMGIIK
jgi:hypothetical protein